MAKRGNGEGSIYYLEHKKLWAGQFTNGFKVNGKINRKTVYGKTRKEVAEKITKALSEVQENKYIDRNNVTMEELVDEYIEDKYKSNLVTVNTHIRDIETKKRIKQLSNILDMPVQKIRENDLKKFLYSITDYSNSAIDKMYRMIKCGLSLAVHKKLLSENLLEGKRIAKPKSKNPPKSVLGLTIEEQKKLLQVLADKPNKYNNIILLMLYTGMRIGEVLALSINNIDDNYIHIKTTLTRSETDTFVIGKTTKTYTSTRDIAITPIVKQILSAAKSQYVNNPDKLLFYDELSNSLIKPYEINMYLKRLNAKYNIADGLHNHMLRHTYATRCIESGMSAVVLAKKLGHKDVSVTLNTYTSVFSKYEDTQDDRFMNYLEQEVLQPVLQRQ